jgi:hypothetical protein
MAYDVLQVQVPTFLNRQVLTMAAPGAKLVPSGIVTSATNSAASQAVAATGRGPKTVPGMNCTSRVTTMAIGIKMRRNFISSSLQSKGTGWNFL